MARILDDSSAHHVSAQRPRRSKFSLVSIGVSSPTIKALIYIFATVYLAGAIVIFHWTERHQLHVPPDTLGIRGHTKRRDLLENISPIISAIKKQFPRTICIHRGTKRTTCTKLYQTQRSTVPDHPELQRQSESERKKTDEAQVQQPDQSVCVPTEDWQTTHHPSCNTFQEINVPNSLATTTLQFVAAGGWRGVWKFSQGNYQQQQQHLPALALKMIKFERKKYRTYNQQTYHRHIVDAVASDRLSGLDIATNIYGFCGHSVLNHFGDANLLRTIKTLGDIDREHGFKLDWKSNDTLTTRVLMARGLFDRNDTYAEYYQQSSAGNGTMLKAWPTLKQRVQYARDAALVLANMRSVDWHGGNVFNVTIVHHDLKPDNFIILPNGAGLRLNDFNDATLLLYNTTSAGPCLFRCRKHNPFYQSPEEAWEIPLSHAVDLHSLGGVLYFILLGKRPYFDLEPEFAFAYLSKEVFPLLPVGFNMKDSGNRAVTTMLQLIQRLRSGHPARRPSASDVVAELDSLLENYWD